MRFCSFGSGLITIDINIFPLVDEAQLFHYKWIFRRTMDNKINPDYVADKGQF